MRILIAPDKFKGSLTARQAAEAIAAGIRRVRPDAMLDLCPLADGGEGTVDALVAATNGTKLVERVIGPLPEMRVDAEFGMLGDGRTAVIEMSAASGLALLRPDERNPLYTTTFGTGQLLLAAVKRGASRIVLGIGGSATTDAGIGCAQAAGLTVLLEGGEPVSMTEPLCGQDMDRVVLVKRGRGSPIDHVHIIVACDVTNPLFGPGGAALIFGPQKGASPEDVRQLDQSLQALARRLGKLDVADHAGAGAAGGLGFGMMAYFGARLRSGIELVMEAAHLRDRLHGVDLCITGEGKLDAQSLAGKTPIGVARACKEAGVMCVAAVGVSELTQDQALGAGLCRVQSLLDHAGSAEEALANAGKWLGDAAAALLADRH